MWYVFASGAVYLTGGRIAVKWEIKQMRIRELCGEIMTMINNCPSLIVPLFKCVRIVMILLKYLVCDLYLPEGFFMGY